VLLLPKGARYYCCYSCCWRELCVSYNQPKALRFLQPTKVGTNEVGTLESRCQNFSFSPILFLSSSCWVKKKKNKCVVGRSCSAIGHRSNALRPSTLLAIATTLRGPARFWPSQQRCEVERVATVALEKRCKLQCVASQRRNNVASYNALGHRCSVARSCSVVPSLAIAAAATELYTFNVGLSSNFRSTSRPASLLMSSSYVLLASST